MSSRQPSETSSNVRKLPLPSDRLFLQEMDSFREWINYVLGNLLVWELGEEDSRLAEQGVNSKRSNREPKSAGLEKID